MEAYDVVIIGAGHNGLVCAGYYTKSWLQHLIVGGADRFLMVVAQPKNLCQTKHLGLNLTPVQ